MLKRYALLMLAAALMISLGCGPARGEGAAHVLADQEAMDVACARVVPDVVPGFLPVFMHAKTKEKVIALTIDDCNQEKNLRAILSLFQKYIFKTAVNTFRFRPYAVPEVYLVKRKFKALSHKRSYHSQKRYQAEYRHKVFPKTVHR